MEVRAKAKLIVAMTTHGLGARHRLEARNLLQLAAYEAVVAQVGHPVLHELVQLAHPQHSLHVRNDCEYKFYYNGKKGKSGGTKVLHEFVQPVHPRQSLHVKTDGAYNRGIEGQIEWHKSSA